jgi:hypothetical protein
MTQPTPYEQLGITDDASTEEILQARDRMLAEADLANDRKQREQIETAYDAVLMDRLRQRQEGKIKVPDRIRFPEKSTQPVPNFVPTLPTPKATWLNQLLRRPSIKELGLPTAIFAGLGIAGSLYINLQQLVLMAGVIACIYFVNRRERRMGKSILVGLAGLLGGFLIGGLVWTVLKPQLIGIGLASNVLDTSLAIFLLWFLSCFLG